METLRPIEVLAGVAISGTDNTALATPHFVASDKIRFVNGRPEKIGGWNAIGFTGSTLLSGVARMFFSYQFNGSDLSIIGTNEKLYSFLLNELTNITPFKTSTIDISNSLSSNFYGSATLGANPLESFSGSTFVKILNVPTGHPVQVGDRISISGAVGFNGIPTGELNTTHVVVQSQTNHFSFNVVTPATSSGTGGGVSIDVSTAILTLDETTHGMSNGDRVVIAGSTDVGGLQSDEINLEHIIRNVTTNSFFVPLTTFATSSVTGGGGASVTYREEIDPGEVNAAAGQGYGLGRYGVGRYGVPKTSSSLTKFPRIWSADRYGNSVVTTPGQNGQIYIYTNDQNSPPILANAPTANYVFTTDNIIVALGADSIGNRIRNSDLGDSTDWTPTSTNFAAFDDIEGANEFVSHASLKGINLLFTENQVYTFRFRRQPVVPFEIKLIESTVGIISQNARIVVDGAVFWMSNDNFYFYTGGSVQIIPSNSYKESTIKDFVFNRLNFSQKTKIFAWLNHKFNEIWWHYPSGTNLEPDSIVRFNYKDFTWCPDTLERTAAEYPVSFKEYHQAIQEQDIFNHEFGNDADGIALPFSLKSKDFVVSYETIDPWQIIPDSIQTENVDLTLETKIYPQSSFIDSETLTVTPTTEFVNPSVNGRVWNYQIAGNALGQRWQQGQWLEVIEEGGE